jgi:flagellar biosynthetic protein FliR
LGQSPLPFPLPLAIDRFTLFWLVFARAGGIFATAPLLSATGAVPAPVRVGLALLAALAALPGVAPPAGGLPGDALGLVALGAHEVLIGLVVGALARLVYAVGELAGSLCDVQLGLTVSAVIDPLHGVPASILSSWLHLLTALAFLGGGGLELLAQVLAESYRHLPVGSPVLLEGGIRTLVEALGWAFATAVALAAPVLAAGLLINVVLGLVSRAVPQLNVLQGALPAQVLGGLAVLLLAAPLLVAGLSDLVPATARWLGRLWP